MRLVFLSSGFYEEARELSEAIMKVNRPFIMILLKLENLTFAVPFRSHISHRWAFFTDLQNKRGIDYSKAILISDSSVGATALHFIQN